MSRYPERLRKLCLDCFIDSLDKESDATHPSQIIVQKMTPTLETRLANGDFDLVDGLPPIQQVNHPVSPKGVHIRKTIELPSTAPPPGRDLELPRVYNFIPAADENSMNRQQSYHLMCL